jgi:hypothetical protein
VESDALLAEQMSRLRAYGRRRLVDEADGLYRAEYRTYGGRNPTATRGSRGWDVVAHKPASTNWTVTSREELRDIDQQVCAGHQ